MAKHPTSSRVKREDTAPDDAFVGLVKRSYTWGQENARVLAIGFAVILVVAAGAVWFISQQRQMETAAAASFAEVQQTVASGNVQLAIRDLRSYLNRFGETEAADQARLLLADLLIGEEQPQPAIEVLDDLPNDLERPLGLAAARMEAAALEAAGQLDQAVDTYLRIADDARFTFQQREALEDAARVRLLNGDPDEAVDLYERLVATFEEGEPGRGYYEMWLAEARAQAETGVAVTPGADAEEAPAAAEADTGAG